MGNPVYWKWKCGEQIFYVTHIKNTNWKIKQIFLNNLLLWKILVIK